jgi:hypothetical protein
MRKLKGKVSKRWAGISPIAKNQLDRKTIGLCPRMKYEEAQSFGDYFFIKQIIRL